ncbi:carbohydrate ABC transporter substrate-binding protein (CUT1 family) [Labedella gwakjiensis]|uniref:Carbohydrate ABC transporter substrate-binding protein (CUT1 family) n=1 Tax=Labedella gwakjiensis TaxID=390269 RepID=A0A2P8GUF2_9MICO|nr:sugar ABC transporter substrate-binding protein [Labedella gwakjiensis]PSL37594.1 carbohydrate ABC transporter substrate-binding protein (CUT1 family) [Labedella gwakjiensis]RUQ84893.1 sugar ABC transporter substrate-binding protein [Labedella gwakjiensis]
MTSAKKLSATAAIAVAALALSGCAGSTGGGASADDPVSLRMTVWTSNEDQLALFDSIAEEYMADHPEVSDITFDPLDFESYTTTLTTQLAGGNPPDMAWVLENAAPDFVSSGALVPLDDVLSATDGYDLDDLSASATELWRDADGALAAYPFSTSPFVVFANDDLLAEAGAPTAAELQADGDWNWETISEIGSQVNAATGKAGFVVRDFEYTQWDYLSTVWGGWGAEPWSEDGADCTMDSDEMVDAFTFLHDAAFDATSMPGPGSTADFFAGDAAFTVTQISRASLLEESGIQAWELAPLPEGPAGEYSIIGQAGVGALAQGENPEEAAEFIAFFTNPENSEKLAQYFPPARESQLNAETLVAANPVLTEEQLSEIVVPAVESGEVRPSHTGSAEIQQAVRSALDALWVADADIPGTLSAVCEAIDPLLEQ